MSYEVNSNKNVFCGELIFTCGKPLATMHSCRKFYALNFYVLVQVKLGGNLKFPKRSKFRFPPSCGGTIIHFKVFGTSNSLCIDMRMKSQ